MGVVALVFAFVPPRTTASGDIRPHEELPLALLGDGIFYLDAVVEEAQTPPYWVRRVGPHYVSAYPVLTGLLNVPVVGAAMLLGIDVRAHLALLSHLTAAWISALATALFFALAFRHFGDVPLAALAAFVFFFACPVWSVTARGLWAHGPSLLFLCAGALLLSADGKSVVGIAGLMLGLFVAARPSNAVMALPLGLWVLLARPDARMRFAVLGALPVLAVLVYAEIWWGDWRTLATGNSLDLTTPPWIGLPGVLASPSRGLFVYCPVLLLGLAELGRSLVREPRDSVWRFYALAVLALIGLVAVWQVWWGGWSFGPRLLIEATPLLVLFVVRVLARTPRPRFLTGAFAALLVISVLVQGLGATVYPCGFNGSPVNIDVDRGRLWSLSDSQLERCLRLLIGRDGGQT